MFNNRGRFSVFQVVVLLAILSACGSQPRSTYPVLERTVESDANLDCPGFDDELLKANAIRDAIYEEHGDVIGDAVLASTLDVLTDPVTGLFSTVLRGSSASVATRKYAEAAIAAGQRMEQLLIYKEQRSCPSGPTGTPGLTDNDALATLQDLQRQLHQQEISQKVFLQQRRQLLDDLR